MEMARGLSRSARGRWRGQDAIAAFRLDAIGIDLDGQCHSAVEVAAAALHPLHARLVGLVDLGAVTTVVRLDAPARSLVAA
jgi:hypothetical protein